MLKEEYPHLRYFTTARLPTEKAHGIQIVSMCESFAKLTNTELVIPRRKTLKDIDAIFSYYAIRKNFVIRTLPIIDTTALSWFLGPLSFALLQRSFAYRARRDAIKKPTDLYYVRDDRTFIELATAELPTIFETHITPPNLNRFMRALHRCVAIVVISKTIQQELISAGVPKEKIIYAPDGVKLEQFATTQTKQEARLTLGINSHTEMILYTGQLFPWKGVDTLIEASRHLPPGKEIFIVGGGAGREDELKTYAYKEKLPVHFIGQVPHKDIPLYLTAADCVVIPTSSKERIGSHYTSPLKLFEAMSMQKAIIASDLPSLREIIDETCAAFFIPDNPSSLATTIIETLKNTEKRMLLEKKARERAQHYSWDARAQYILDEIRTILDHQT